MTATTHADPRPAVLDAYRRALGREAHVLTQRPDLVFPQLHDRLQWEEGEVAVRLASARNRRLAAGRPWLRTRHPRIESTAHVRTLRGLSCVFAPDGSWLASASEDGTVVLWDTDLGTARTTLRGHRLDLDGRRHVGGQASVTACAVSADGARLVTGGHDGTLRVWDVATGAAVAQLASCGGFNQKVEDCACDPAGSRVLFARDRELELWDVRTDDEPVVLTDDLAFVAACAFRADGRRAVAADLDGVARVWDFSTGEVVGEFDGHEGPAWTCAFAPDGDLIATGGEDGTVRLWDVDAVQERTLLVGHYGRVSAVAFHPDGRSLASVGEDGTVRLWDVTTGQELALLVGHDVEASDCAFSPDGRLLATAGEDVTVRLWDVGRSRPARDLDQANTPVQLTLAAHEGPVLGCAYNSDGTRLASVGQEGWVLLWDAETLDVDTELGEHDAAATACVFSPDDTRLASVSRDRTVGVWDLVGDADPTALTGLPRAHGCAFSPDGQLVATVGEEGYVVLWDTPVTGVPWTADGRLVAQQFWNTTACAFSPNGRLLATADDEGGVVLRNVPDGSEALVLDGHAEAVRSCAFGPDGLFLATAADDGTVCVWDVQQGGVGRVLVGHRGPVLACAFTPDGGRLVSTGEDGTVRLWEPGPGRELAALSLPGRRHAVAVHPWLPRVAIGEAGGGVNVLDVIGPGLGPVVVTAVARGRHLRLRCPACGQHQRVRRKQLGTLATCRTPECGHELRVNEFVLVPSSGAAGATQRGEVGR